MYKIEIFSDQLAYVAAAIISAPDVSLDYLTFDAFSVPVPTLACKKGYFAHITHDAELVADGIVSDVQPGVGTVDISLRPLQALFDVEVFASPIPDVATWLLEQINAEFVSNADTLQNRPVQIASKVRAAQPITLGDEKTLNLVDIMAQALTSYGIFLDARLDLGAKKIVVDIVPQPAAVVLEADLDNVLDKSITLGDSYGSANKMTIRKEVTDPDTDEVSYPSSQTYYLHTDGSVDTTDADRVTPVFWTLADLADSETWDADALAQAVETLTPQQYDNEIVLQYRSGDALVHPETLQPGTPCTIYTGGVAYSSLLTAKAYSAGTVELTFGAVRVALTKQLILERRRA